MEYPQVVLGGTFETIHKGHEALLEAAFSAGEKVLIGLTSDEYVRVHKPAVVKSFDDRKTELEAWLRDRNWFDRAVIVPIHDQYGPTTSDRSLSAIVVSTETAPVVAAINRMRIGNYLPPLSVIEVPMVFAVDRDPISTTRIRKGDIDRDGNLVMPTEMRGELGKPFGDVLPEDRAQDAFVQDSDNKKIIIAVGDRTTKRILDAGITPVLSVIDLKVDRKPFMPFEQFQFPKDIVVIKVTSGPGFIAADAVRAIGMWAKVPVETVIIVTGEEDLIALPLFVHAPDGSVVYYGQPESGLVRVEVTVEIRRQAAELLARFS